MNGQQVSQNVEIVSFRYGEIMTTQDLMRWLFPLRTCRITIRQLSPVVKRLRRYLAKLIGLLMAVQGEQQKLLLCRLKSDVLILGEPAHFLCLLYTYWVQKKMHRWSRKKVVQQCMNSPGKKVVQHCMISWLSVPQGVLREIPVRFYGAKKEKWWSGYLKAPYYAPFLLTDHLAYQADLP